ncbi:MAG: hypothetical protein HUJ75_06890, partial [Parasporobacterium sp.]|nr:hypothetical protein [Parasporobacterium sp.]
GEYLAARYIPINDQTSAQAAITARPVTITANNASVWFGDPAPAYDVTYEKATATSGRGLVSGETADKSHVTITCSYAPGDDVQKYTDAIVPSDFTGSTTALLSNYAPSYEPGDLDVKQRRLNTPAPVWKTNSPGVITWDAVPAVNKVEVDSYTVQLYADGTALTAAGAQLTVAAGATLEADFLSLMRANGPGAYTVKVTAIASTVNNPDKADVEDSLAGTSAARYAANMIFSFADDTISQAGKTADIKVNSAASYVVIAGEKDIDITATLVNATGYTIKDVKAAETVSIIDKTDSARTADKFATRVSLAENHSSADDINIKLELSARPATLNAVVKPIANGDGTVTNETTYGYSANTAPVFKVTTSNTDEVAPPSYTYSYAWELRTSRTVEKFTDAAYNKDTWTLPLGKKANGSATYYLVRCVVTATRSDNGQYITLNQSFNDYASKYAEDNSLYNVIVNKAAFTATVTMDDWTYGEVPENPVLHYADAVKDNESIKITEYKYAPKGGNTWSDTKPSDAGEYQVKAYIPASGDYNEYTTPSVNFTISKAKLDKPENLTMSHSSTADYGLISWDKVDGPKKDGTGTAVAVKYQVKLYKDGDAAPFKTYDPIDGLSLDVTADLQLGATYKVELTAISQDSANCQDSDSVFINDIAVGATISVTGTGTLSGNTFTQKYDATTITLTAQASGNVTAYQWYEDGNVLAGATGQTYTLSHVAESGKYTCVVTTDGKEVHTPIMNVVVTKRSLTLTSGTDEKTYDGTALIKHTVAVTGDGFAASEGMDYNFTGTATNVSDTADNNNTFTASFKTGTAATDYETPVKNYGKLTINPKEIVITPGFTYSEIPDVVYKAAAYTPEPTITDISLAGGASQALVKDKDFTFAYSNNVNAGENTAAVTITGKGNYSGTVTLNFTIKKRPVVFSAVSEEKTYSGSEIKIEGLTVNSGTNAGLVTGHKHNVKFAASGTEASDTAYQGTITDKSAVVITLADGTTVVTDNYDITVNNGTLKIKQTEEAFTVSLPKDSHVYSGLDQYNTKTASDTARTGTTKYEYSFTDGSGYVSDLKTLTKKDVGDYTIYVKATNPNYKNAATTTATLTITKAPLTVVTGGASRAYNGNPLTNADISVTGLKNGETLGSVTTGTITDKGTTDNTYTLTFAAADNSYTAKAGNYEVISETKGTLEVTALAVNVTINGATLTKTYDGTKYEATGWSFTADSNLYKKEYISHTGPETAARTHVVEGTDTDGITDMGLAVSQFANINTNFNVSFTVNDGWMKIEPLKNVTVSITGKNITKTYDSSESTASGYDWDTANTLYKTYGSFTFNGKASASRTNVVEGADTDGRTDMGLREAQFTNTNTDFDEVKFSITDGYVQINPIDGVTVSIIGDTYVNTYDGGSHTASGYSWSADNTLYRNACFSFSGTDSVTGKDAGKTFMGLKETQFRNIDTNFTNVTFSVTDGYTDISKKAAKIKVKDSAKAYGNTDPAFTGDFVDLVSGETLVGVVYRRTNSAEDVGYYSKVLTADYGNNPNYDITVENADFEITKTNTLTVTGTSYSDTYDGNVHGLPAVANVTTGTTIYYSLDGGVNWDTEVPTIKDVDEFTVDVKAVNSNYSDA